MHAALAHGISNSCPHKQIWPPSFNQLPSFPSKECGRVEGPLYNYADPSNLVIVNAYTQKSVRTQSRNDEGPILVGKGNNVTTFEEATADGLLEQLQPSLYAKGRDYSLKTLPEKDTLKKLDIKAVFVGDKKSHSTTKLIQKIQKLKKK